MWTVNKSGVLVKEQISWAKLSSNEKLWFARHLSTGCGPDSWKRGGCMFKRIIDDWWEAQACLEHDFDYFLGFVSERERLLADIRFAANALNATPHRPYAVATAYRAIRGYDGAEFLERRRGREEFRWCIKYVSGVKERESRVPDSFEIMKELRDAERGGLFAI